MLLYVSIHHREKYDVFCWLKIKIIIVKFFVDENDKNDIKIEKNNPKI